MPASEPKNSPAQSTRCTPLARRLWGWSRLARLIGATRPRIFQVQDLGGALVASARRALDRTQDDFLQVGI